jgi:acyl-CoA synthetase (AMP-forming)/AMP-acid ligase II
VTEPDKTAIVMDASTERTSYAQLEERSVRLANALRARGLRRGDVVAIMSENHIRYFEAYWAAIRSGLYITPINRHLKAGEISYQLSDSGAAALVASHAFAAMAAGALAQAPGVRVRLMWDGVADGFESYEAALNAASPVQSEPMPLGEAMVYSSGTTGRPKGIARPLRDIDLASPEHAGTGALARLILRMSEKSVYLCPAPLYHSAGLIWSAGVHELGATLVVMEKFDPGRLLALIERERVTHVQVVPTMLVRVLKLGREVRDQYDLSSLECVVTAAAPCPADVKRQMIDWLGPIVDEYYAMTEGSGLTFISARDWLAHPGSVGKPITGVPHVCDELGADLPAGEPGLVYFEQPTAPFEYHGDPEKTRNSRHPDHQNWTAVGDVGYLDEEGYLYLTDRQSFMIISGGVNIYPAEIEDALVMHPAVLDVAVFGVPDPEMGEFVQAVVQIMPGFTAGAELAEELRDYVRGRVASYKVPRRVDFLDELPRLPTGKLAKAALRAQFLAARP